MNNKSYTLHFYPKSDNPKWDNRYQLRKISPYDEAEYYWAYSYDKKNWNIIYNGKPVFSVSDKSKDEIIEILEQYNQKIKMRICHN